MMTDTTTVEINGGELIQTNLWSKALKKEQIKVLD